MKSLRPGFWIDDKVIGSSPGIIFGVYIYGEWMFDSNLGSLVRRFDYSGPVVRFDAVLTGDVQRTYDWQPHKP